MLLLSTFFLLQYCFYLSEPIAVIFDEVMLFNLILCEILSMHLSAVHSAAVQANQSIATFPNIKVVEAFVECGCNGMSEDNRFSCVIRLIIKAFLNPDKIATR